MQKKLFILSIVGVSIIGLTLLYDKENNKTILENTDINSQIINNNALTMMYETEAGSGEYQVSSDTSWPQSGYVFNETLSKCENGGVLTWDDENKKVLLQTNSSDKCYVYFDKSITLANYIMNNVYTGTDGENGLYYHDGVGSYTNADQEAGDYSYRYSGANPNNYVCFGSDEEVCPDDNLYRIIGVFDNEVKLIKNTSIGYYAWDNDEVEFTNSDDTKEKYVVPIADWIPSDSGSNEWNTSDINYHINNDYYFDTLDINWQNKVALNEWKIGGNTNNNILNTSIKQTFTNEIINPTEDVIYIAKIGLMYVSDYGYAVSPENWTQNMETNDKNNYCDRNWMFKNTDEWTITKIAGTENMVVRIHNSCSLFTNSVDGASAIRPAFFLNSNVQYGSGTGTQTDPYRIV